MNEIVDINMFKVAALLLAERRRQVREYLKENPNDYEYTEEYKELCYKIDSLKHQYIHWRNKQYVIDDIPNTFMRSSIADYKQEDYKTKVPKLQKRK